MSFNIIRKCGMEDPQIPQRLIRVRRVRRKKIHRVGRYHRHEWKRSVMSEFQLNA